MILGSCTDDKVTDINLNFKLSYEGAPLVMLQDYPYPDGRTIRFNRVSFYISEIEALNGNTSTTIQDAAMINLGISHSSTELASEGFTYTIPNIPIDKMDAIRFNIGLSPALNAKTPAEYDAGHPLANSAEYWIGWQSYVFVKFEGFVDLDNNGSAESTFALHLGSDAIRRSVTFRNPKIKDDVAHFDFNLDVKKVFDNGTIYDIVTTPNIHSLSQINQANFLIENVVEALSMTNQ
jgi:hypothetical protein